MIPQAPPHDLKRPSESEQEPCDGKKPRTEDPLVAANALACFAGPGSEDGSDTTDAAPSNENKQPVKQDEAPKDSVHYDDDDTETTVSCASDSVVVAAAAVVGTAGAAAAAAAASGAIQRAMLAVKQEQHTLAEREDKVKLQRSKAARFCAESRARRRLRTMVFDQSADPITQQLRLTQLQQLQQTQIRNQARCLVHPHTPHPRLVPGPVRLSSPIVARLIALRLSPVAVLRSAAIAEQRRDRSSSSGPYRPCSAVPELANVLSAAQPSSRRVLPFLSRPSEHGSTIPAAARLPRVESLRPQRNANSYSDDAIDPCTPTNGLSRGKRIPSPKRDGTMGGDRLLPRARAGVRVHRASIYAPAPCSSILRTPIILNGHRIQ